MQPSPLVQQRCALSSVVDRMGAAHVWQAEQFQWHGRRYAFAMGVYSKLLEIKQRRRDLEPICFDDAQEEEEADPPQEEAQTE